ncbi:MAG: cytochrome c3 family protein [Thermodesulfobacteriota bacterium]|nr:cytochrome c3 family protein [Thermodesulfobacteriota bacterium]
MHKNQTHYLTTKRVLIHAITQLMVCILITLSTRAAEYHTGAEKIQLEGGKRGIVPFPHHRHQKALDDCNTCHTLFPLERGALGRLKAMGVLQKKQVMNKLCIKCHRTEKKAGNPHGPTTCSKCHVRKK